MVAQPPPQTHHHKSTHIHTTTQPHQKPPKNKILFNKMLGFCGFCVGFREGVGIKKRAGQHAVVRLLGGSDLLSHFRSTIGAVRFNFSVRNGKRWNPHAITTLVSFSPLCVRCVKVRSFLEVQNAVSLGLSCRLKRHRCHSIRAPGFALPSRV